MGQKSCMANIIFLDPIEKEVNTELADGNTAVLSLLFLLQNKLQEGRLCTGQERVLKHLKGRDTTTGTASTPPNCRVGMSTV